MFDLTGKIAVVTGAGRGIGAQIRQNLAAAGATVISTDTAACFPGLTPGSVGDVEGIGEAAVMDVTNPASLDATIGTILAKHGRIDILVNNAGITKDQLLMRMKHEEWDAVLNVNLTGTFNCTQAVLKPMLKQRGGRIISISSVVGQMGNAGQTNYAASKAGIIGFSKALAREVASRAITVNVVAPGLIDSAMTRVLPPEVQEQWVSKVPLGRFGTADDVAHAVCFLASDEAAYITGQVLAVNGGMYT
jgi:3-oxoacyl-[acyl-carrier protein] reductase